MRETENHVDGKSTEANGRQTHSDEVLQNKRGNAMIINLTQHTSSPEQTAAGVVEPNDKELVSAILTFDEVPTHANMLGRAWALASLARIQGAEKAMIGGAPFFMAVLETALREDGIEPVYAFSKRESVDIPIPESEGGGMRKVAVFRHVGFVTTPNLGATMLPTSFSLGLFLS